MGPAALRNSYSVKGLVTRTLPMARLHLNASYGSFSYRQPTGLDKIIPPIHGPCVFQTPGAASGGIRALCSPSATSTPASASAGALAETGPIVTRGQWVAGVAVDKAFPLRSLLLIADIYAQKYESINRPVDWTAEIGARRQMTRGLVLDAALGRLFTGESKAWFLNVGTTLSRPLHL